MNGDCLWQSLNKTSEKHTTPYFIVLSRIETTLRESGCGEELLRALMREMTDLQIEFDLNGFRSSPIAILAGILQGDPASPLVCIATIGRLLRPGPTPHR